MCSHVFPALYLNLGAEMMYVLDQRLRRVEDREKSDKVVKEIMLGFLAKKTLEEVFKGHGTPTRAGLKMFFEKVAHCSIMRLNENSMDKLFDLMMMSYKFQLMKMVSPEQIVTITVNHLRALLDLVPLDREIGAAVEHAHTMVAHLPENSTLGSIVARVSIAQMYRDTKLRLTGTSSLCPQQTDQSHVYLLLLCGILDRETTSEYHLKFLLEKDGQIVVEHPQLLTIGDINDNSPQWHSSQIHISLNRTQGGSRTLTAKDPDLGQNGWIRYSVLDTEVVSIDKETGRIFVPNTSSGRGWRKSRIVY
uniref:MIR domain-containing protein n=1 Tax=Caenorhabditis tropicalis TaxID=1561998 RepID=A0A1I7UPC6_9PELO